MTIPQDWQTWVTGIGLVSGVLGILRFMWSLLPDALPDGESPDRAARQERAEEKARQENLAGAYWLEPFVPSPRPSPEVWADEKSLTEAYSEAMGRYEQSEAMGERIPEWVGEAREHLGVLRAVRENGPEYYGLTPPEAFVPLPPPDATCVETAKALEDFRRSAYTSTDLHELKGWLKQ